MLPPIADRFVAGESAAEAIEHAESLNERNVKAILNLLGEHYHERDPADQDAEAYLRLVDDVVRSGVDGCISVKPSQIGLDAGERVFEDNLERIVDYAADHGVFTWVDMEDHTTTDRTLDAYEELVTRHDGMAGIAIQSNLRRTADDLERLADLPGKVRLVKGAYDEPASVAYTKKAEVNERYETDLEYMFREFDDGAVAVGSHDPRMIDHAKRLHEEYGTDFEIQMLMGIRDDAQFELAGEYEVWQYVPYGSKWFSYFYRRAMERKENLLFAARAVLGR
ncbi:proline dehydrogenase family protein [Halobacteriaceae archaeon GCM10025711]